MPLNRTIKRKWVQLAKLIIPVQRPTKYLHVVWSQPHTIPATATTPEQSNSCSFSLLGILTAMWAIEHKQNWEPVRAGNEGTIMGIRWVGFERRHVEHGHTRAGMAGAEAERKGYVVAVRTSEDQVHICRPIPPVLEWVGMTDKQLDSIISAENIDTAKALAFLERM